MSEILLNSQSHMLRSIKLRPLTPLKQKNPPKLPLKPFYLEKTNVIAYGNPKYIFNCIYSYFDEYMSSVLTKDKNNYVIECKILIDYTGVCFKINMYRNKNEIIIEGQSCDSRGTLQFVKIFQDLVNHLVDIGLTPVKYRKINNIVAPIPIYLSKLSETTIMMLMKMCLSEELKTVINGTQTLCRMCCETSHDNLNILRSCGVPELLSVIRLKHTHFEIINNCNLALVKFSRKRREAIVDCHETYE